VSFASFEQEALIREALYVVVKLNGLLETQDYVEALFELRTDGKRVEVRFWADGMGEVYIWDSSSDLRDQDEHTGVREDLEAYLRCAAKKRLEDASQQQRWIKLEVR